MEELQQSAEIPGTQPRFHRFEIGRIAFTSVSDGGILVQRPASPNKPPEIMLVPLACLVAKMPNSNQIVLIDSGFGLTPELLGKPMPSAGRLQESLRAAGLSVGSIDVVLVSHLDIDHVAGLYDQNGDQVFRNATYYAPAEAVRFWGQDGLDLSDSPSLPWIKEERMLVATYIRNSSADRIKLFRAGDEVLPGIKAVDLPGHAPGQVGFLFSSEGETLLYTADAITHATVSIQTPEAFNIMDHDPQGGVNTRQQLISFLSNSLHHSFSPHFPWPAWGKVEIADGSAVWKPAV